MTRTKWFLWCRGRERWIATTRIFLRSLLIPRLQRGITFQRALIQAIFAKYMTEFSAPTMDTNLKKKLLDADVAGHWEYPPDWKWPECMAKIEAVRPLLAEVVGKLDMDQNVQDASFTTDLFVLEEGARDPVTNSVAHVYKLAIRFSNFGNLVTIFTNSVRRTLSDYPVARLETILKEHGFDPVPADQLNVPYDGKNVPFENGLTWWTRYFDYL